MEMDDIRDINLLDEIKENEREENMEKERIENNDALHRSKENKTEKMVI